MSRIPAERVVVEAWERQLFDQTALSRLGLRVIFRGVPSDAGGPDYQDAILARDDREILSGDVEFHTRTSDWYRHRHHRDARYDRVVLHVVWIDDGEATVRADGKTVPTVEIGSQDDMGLRTSSPMVGSLLPHPCVATFASVSTEGLRAAIHRAGVSRFIERAERFAAEMSVVPPDQVAYAALLESLGYASNREAFRKLGEAVPYAWLQSIAPSEWAGALLEGAGLGPSGHASPPAHLSPESWRLSRIRPANHPARRILGVVPLLQQLGVPLSDSLHRAVMAAEKPLDLRRSLLVAGKAKDRIGPGRMDEVIASAILPFVAALDPETEKPMWLFERCPSPPANRWTRLMQSLFAQGGHAVLPRTALEQQGLHHLYHRYCRLESDRGGRFPADCPVCGRSSRD